jgi:ESF2/ABP1 family protein
VEFKDKHVAKQIASSLNTQPIGGKGFYAEDLWTLKYLPRFKWQNLTERIALEKASRDQRMRAEMAQAKRENAAYVENAEKASRMEHAQERLKGKGVEVEDGKIRQMFAQRKMITREVRDQVEVEKSVGKRRLLDSLL